MVSQIEKCDENALILIEEIENGLHPLAVRRLVEYLIDVAIRRKAQVIFTTHSEEVLIPLPAKAIWVCANRFVRDYYGDRNCRWHESFDDDLLSMVFDANIEATDLLRIILKQDDIQVVSVVGQREFQIPVVGGRDYWRRV